MSKAFYHQSMEKMDPPMALSLIRSWGTSKTQLPRYRASLTSYLLLASGHLSSVHGKLSPLAVASFNCSNPLSQSHSALSEPQARLDFTITAAAHPIRTRIHIYLRSARVHASSI